MSDSNSIAKNLAEGPVLQQLASFSLPVMAANALQALYSTVDMIVVGQFIGASGLSAVGVGGQLLNLLLLIGMSVGFGAQVLLSQQVGAGDEDLQPTIGTLFTLEIALAVIFGVAGIFLRGPMLQLLNTPAEAWDDAMDYMVICCTGMLFIYGYNAVCAILRGMGESKLPMVFIAIASLVNLVLDLVFVAGLHMGVAGAALATVLGQGVSFLISIVYLYRHRVAFGFDFKPSSFVIRKKYLIPIAKIGIPYVVNSMAIMCSIMYVNARVNTYGVIASAVDSVGGKLLSIMNIVVGAISVSGATMMGQCFGARKFDRMKSCYRACFAICMITWGVLSAVYLLWPHAVFRLFSSEEAVLDMAPQYLQISVVWLLSMCTMTAPYAVVDGVGAAIYGLIVSIADGVVARLGLCILLERVMGLSGLWMGNALAGFVTTLMAGAYYYSGVWKKKKLLLDPNEP